MAEASIPKAFRELFQPHRDKAFFGGRGSAKSWSVATALAIMAAQRPLRIICAREIQSSLRESVKQLVEDRIKAMGLSARFDCLDAETRGRNGSKFIYLGMWRNPEAVKSLEAADIFWGEEASAFSERSIRMVRPTMRKPGSEMWWTWNPEFDHDPVDKLFRGGEVPPGAYVKEVSWKDNPWFDASPLRAEMDYDYRTDPSRAAHVWGGGYVTSVEGSYYATQLAQAREDGRIGVVPVDPVMERRAFWDLGVNDAQSIWVAQFVGREIRVIDHCVGSGQPLDYYTNWLRTRGHGEALCVLPHDGAKRDSVRALKFEEHVRDAGFRVETIGNQGKGAALLRVAAARRLFPAIWFNEPTCRGGLKSLAAYHEKRDERRNVGLGPEHDFASNDADAFGLMCIAYQEPIDREDDEFESDRFRRNVGRSVHTGY